MDKTSLGNRIKGYEKASEVHLLRRTPVLIRVDGRAFHTLTRGMERPFDDKLIDCMATTTQKLVENVDGCNFGYTQSDEITLLLTDYATLETQPWFDYRKSKIESMTAAMATAYFGRVFVENFPERFDNSVPLFDSRAFNVPREEVVNAFIWRQKDWTRNSIQMVGRSHFSQKQLHGKSCNDIQEMLFQEHGINWNDIETYKKRGMCVYRELIPVTKDEEPKLENFGLDIVYKLEYKIDLDIPIFTQNRNFIQKFVDVDI